MISKLAPLLFLLALGFHLTSAQWTCDITWYNTTNGCDCNCGMYDPDCLDPLAVVWGCNFTERGLAFCNLNGTCEYHRVPLKLVSPYRLKQLPTINAKVGEPMRPPLRVNILDDKRGIYTSDPITRYAIVTIASSSGNTSEITMFNNRVQFVNGVALFTSLQFLTQSGTRILLDIISDPPLQTARFTPIIRVTRGEVVRVETKFDESKSTKLEKDYDLEVPVNSAVPFDFFVYDYAYNILNSSQIPPNGKFHCNITDVSTGNPIECPPINASGNSLRFPSIGEYVFGFYYTEEYPNGEMYNTNKITGDVSFVSVVPQGLFQCYDLKNSNMITNEDLRVFEKTVIPKSALDKITDAMFIEEPSDIIHFRFHNVSSSPSWFLTTTPFYAEIQNRLFKDIIHLGSISLLTVEPNEIEITFQRRICSNLNSTVVFQLVVNWLKSIANRRQIYEENSSSFQFNDVIYDPQNPQTVNDLVCQEEGGTIKCCDSTLQGQHFCTNSGISTFTTFAVSTSYLFAVTLALVTMFISVCWLFRKRKAEVKVIEPVKQKDDSIPWLQRLKNYTRADLKRDIFYVIKFPFSSLTLEVFNTGPLNAELVVFKSGKIRKIIQEVLVRVAGSVVVVIFGVLFYYLLRSKAGKMTAYCYWACAIAWFILSIIHLIFKYSETANNKFYQPINNERIPIGNRAKVYVNIMKLIVFVLLFFFVGLFGWMIVLIAAGVLLNPSRVTPLLTLLVVIFGTVTSRAKDFSRAFRTADLEIKAFFSKIPKEKWEELGLKTSSDDVKSFLEMHKDELPNAPTADVPVTVPQTTNSSITTKNDNSNSNVQFTVPTDENEITPSPEAQLAIKKELEEEQNANVESVNQILRSWKSFAKNIEFKVIIVLLLVLSVFCMSVISIMIAFVGLSKVASISASSIMLLMGYIANFQTEFSQFSNLRAEFFQYKKESNSLKQNELALEQRKSQSSLAASSSNNIEVEVKNSNENAL